MRLSLGAIDLSNGKRYVLDGSEIPFPDTDSVVALLPEYAQGAAAGTQRDAVLNTIAALQNKIWADTGLEQNAFKSPRFAAGGMLDIWGFVRKMPRSVGESDGAYRTRLLAAEDGITPNAIKAAVLAAAADFFGAKVVFQEPANDCEFYAEDDPTTDPWDSFWQPDAGIYWNFDPGSPNQTSGGYWVSDTSGAQGWVIMQLGAGSDASTLRLTDDNDVSETEAEYFYADDTVDFGFWGFDGDPLEIRIVAEVEARRAFGVVWMLIEDPNLNGAV